MISVGSRRGRHRLSHTISRGLTGDGETSRPCSIQGNGEGTGGNVQEGLLTITRTSLSPYRTAEPGHKAPAGPSRAALW